MAMGDGDGVEFLVFNELVHGETRSALAFRVNTRVEEDPVSLHLNKPARSTNIRIRVQVGDSHNNRVSRAEAGHPLLPTVPARLDVLLLLVALGERFTHQSLHQFLRAIVLGVTLWHFKLLYVGFGKLHFRKVDDGSVVAFGGLNLDWEIL